MSENWQESGKEPDYRFSLANERTFLAWIRTALAILAGAILLHQIQSGVRPMRFSAVSGACIAMVSAIAALGAYFRWRSNEIAMRNDRPLPRSILIPFMAAIVALVGATSAAVFLVRG